LDQQETSLRAGLRDPARTPPGDDPPRHDHDDVAPSRPHRAPVIGVSRCALTAGFIGIRLAGQGALTLAATTLVAYYVGRRLGTAIGLVTATGSAAISLAPIGLEILIAEHGYRTAWLVQGFAVWLILTPLALWGLPRRPGAPPAAEPPEPQDRPDPTALEPPHPQPAAGGVAAAVRSAMFWALAGGVGVLSLIGTALTFHQIDLLGERGLTPTQAAATFLPQTVAGLACTLLVGVLLDRVSPRPVMIGSMLALAAALVSAGHLGPGWGAVAYGVVLGVAGNSFRTVEAAAMPRYFGTDAVGAIRGIVHAVTVAGSAVGPLLLALGHSVAGSYRPLLLALTALPLTLIVAIALVPEPRPAAVASAPR
uniref:MFS transporter n=1 Tax=Pseudonocardia sp. H11422 TaxID=2835866 RepID=UPI001BDCFEA3